MNNEDSIIQSVLPLCGCDPEQLMFRDALHPRCLFPKMETEINIGVTNGKPCTILQQNESRKS